MAKCVVLPLSRRLLYPCSPHLPSMPFSSASASLCCDPEIAAPLEPEQLLASPPTSPDLSTHDNSASCTSETPSEPHLSWYILPPVPRLRGLARILEPKELTATKWVRRCCPEISHNCIEKIFRMRQVRMCFPISQSDEAKKSRLKRITRKDTVPEGSVLYLPKFVLRLMDSTDYRPNTNYASKVTKGNSEKVKPISSNVMEYKPTRADIEWASELVLHMDAHILALNKPPGLPVQGGIGVRRNLDALLGSAFSFDYTETPKLVHRLDKETSGVMVIGRTRESTALLHNMFRKKTENAIAGCKDNMLHDRVIKRKYWALVIGAPTVRKGRITAPLKKVVLDGGRSEAIVIADDSDSGELQEAITDYKVLGPSVHGCTWLELHPLTGRKHQIRVHCAQAIGMPILGDYKYGRQTHERWQCKDDPRGISQEDDVHKDDQRVHLETSSLSSQVEVKGSVTSKTPFLHLHSRLLAIPKIRELKKKKLHGKDRCQNEKTAFVDSLRLLAPLPPHMKASWNLLPPTLKDPILRAAERQGQ